MSVEKTEIETFFGRCRCCLSYGYLKNMWSEYDHRGETEIYGEMLVQCFALSWDHSEDTMEQDQICEMCITRLRDATEFKKVVLESQDELIQNFEAENDVSIKNEVLDEQYLEEEDTADTNYADTEYTVDTADTGESVKDDTEYQEIEFLEDEDVGDIKEIFGTDPSLPLQSRPKRRKILKTDPEDDVPKRKWPKKLPKAERLKTYKQYTEEMFRKCMEAVRNEEMTPQEASKKYHVPKKTICAKLRLDPDGDVQIDNTTETLEPYKSKLRSKTAIAKDKETKKNSKPTTKKGAHEKYPSSEDDYEESEFSAIDKQRDNMKAILQHSNATIIGGYGKNGYSCSFCEEETDLPEELKEHNIKTHAREGDEAIKTNSISDLEIKLDVSNLKCKLCKKSIDSLEKLLGHLSVAHTILIHTDVKNYIIPFRFDTVEDFQCVKCKKSFSYFKPLSEHMTEHYRNYECTVCNRGFINRRSMETHNVLHKSGVFKCHNCPKIFRTQLGLNDHTKSAHVIIRYRKCGYCDQRFATRQLVLNHQLEVHGINPPLLSCEECSKSFPSIETLTHHKNIYHLMVKPHKCPHCLMSFNSKMKLRTHIKTHDSTEYFICEICKRAYATQYTLDEHLRRHEDDTCYYCDYCERKFQQKTFFKTHMLKRHGEVV